MKLYFSPGACSLASRVVAAEAGLTLQFEKVDLRTKTTAGGADFAKICPKGYVPALLLDDGELLTEGPAVLQYLAERRADKGLSPAPGTMAYYRQLEMLNYIGGELHKNAGPLFYPNTAAELRAEKTAALQRRYGLVEQQLQGRSYLSGEQFTAADAYLFVVTNWMGKLGVDLSAFPNVQAFHRRVLARPAVQAAMQAEGLLH